MIGYRDTFHDGAHLVVLEGVALEFGPDGVLWHPTSEQTAVLERDGVRKARSPRFDQADPPGRVVTGQELVDALAQAEHVDGNAGVVVEEVGQAGAAHEGGSEPSPAEPEASGARRRRRGAEE